MSKDSVDFAAKDREKENVKVGQNRNKNSNNCITILQMEKEKSQMEQQISELVKNAESKKAEIAILKMEINKLKVNGFFLLFYVEFLVILVKCQVSNGKLDLIYLLQRRNIIVFMLILNC